MVAIGGTADVRAYGSVGLFENIKTDLVLICLSLSLVCERFTTSRACSMKRLATGSMSAFKVMIGRSGFNGTCRAAGQIKLTSVGNVGAKRGVLVRIGSRLISDAHNSRTYRPGL